MSFKRLCRVTAVLAIFGTSALFHPLAAGAATQGDYFIVNYNSQLCIDVPGGTSSNVTMIQYECQYPEQDNQAWDFTDTDNGYYEIWNLQTKKCLTVLNASIDQNAPIIQYTCNGGTNAQWKPIFQGYWDDDAGRSWDWYTLKNRKSGLCLTVKNESTANSATLLQFTCNGGANSIWTWYGVG